ncbi:DUF262 domain-containing protein [Psychrobacter sp. BF1]|uniref:GmrSD restriction endonuclease domain-containing protein n=1 Tax=Psychrobacter sp. BF1 TaxID=2821147 RepID=UPI001C4E2D07|nr:DUF262 domain-containing protein [Psychrobacter sp. BF1]
MKNNSTASEIKPLDISNLLASDTTYLIPMYQRNYAWGIDEIQTLIKDIIDAYKRKPESNYYLGTLVVFKKDKAVFEVIDGQQRLTTLTLLAIYLYKNEISNCAEYLKNFKEPNLHFESRPHSATTLSLLFNKNMTAIYQNDSIVHGYEILEKVMQRLFDKEEPEISIASFCSFLFKNVQIARVPVPQETDLNHYFEVMNNRGEQLEKHEIIKARLLSIIENTKEHEINLADKKVVKSLIHKVWESCSNMNKYVQYGFKTNLRTKIFSDEWNDFKVGSFDDLLMSYKQDIEEQHEINKTRQDRINSRDIYDKNEEKSTLHDILFNKKVIIPSNPNKKTSEDDNEEIYYSIINFPNFLLQVLRIHVNINNNQDVLANKGIPLDDKQLLTKFDEYLINEEVDNQLAKVKNFIYTLLKTKFLFDQNIIKRNTEEGKGHWTLESLKKTKTGASYTQGMSDNLNAELVILQSAFHVSAPAMNYKYWLNASLQYLNHTFDSKQSSIRSDELLKYLKRLAREFMIKRYITPTEESDLSTVIQSYFNDFVNCKEKTDSPSAITIELKQLLTMLSYQKIRSFVFNYLDYLIWSNCTIPSEIRNNFRFTAQGSIEHFLPQNPIHKDSRNEVNINLHQFGNLCLINSNLNSRVSNHMPLAKKEYYDEAFKKSVDSLKLYKMIEIFKSSDNKWGEKQALKHETQMLKLFEKALNINIQGLEQR